MDYADRLIEMDSDSLAIVSEVSVSELRKLHAHCQRVQTSGHVTTRQEVMPLASVPVWVARDYCNKRGIDYARDFMGSTKHDVDFLNSEEVKAWRYWKGRI